MFGLQLLLFISIVLCYHCPVLKYLSVVGVSQDLAVSHTGYIIRTSEKVSYVMNVGILRLTL